MPSYLVPAAILPALSFALQAIPEGVPTRWTKIDKYLKQFCEKHPDVLSSTPIEVSFPFHTWLL